MVDMTLLCPLQSDQECQMVEWVDGVAGGRFFITISIIAVARAGLLGSGRAADGLARPHASALQEASVAPFQCPLI